MKAETRYYSLGLLVVFGPWHPHILLLDLASECFDEHDQTPVFECSCRPLLHWHSSDLISLLIIDWRNLIL